MFIRIEPTSSVPIYRQMIGQIKYQVASGALKEGDKLPSVRELSSILAVNQNTVLKVYKELSREQVVEIVRGDGTYVSSNTQKMPAAEKRKAVAGPLREAVVQAVQLGISIKETKEALADEYKRIMSQKTRAAKKNSSEK